MYASATVEMPGRARLFMINLKNAKSVRGDWYGQGLSKSDVVDLTSFGDLETYKI